MTSEALSPRAARTRTALLEAGLDVVAVRGGHFCHRESPKATTAALLAHFAKSPLPLGRGSG